MKAFKAKWDMATTSGTSGEIELRHNEVYLTMEMAYPPESWETKYHDFSGEFKVGDELNIYGKIVNDGLIKAKNFRIYYDEFESNDP